MKKVKRNINSVDTGVIFFMFFVLGGLLLFNNKSKANCDDPNAFFVEQYSIVKEAIIPKLYEGYFLNNHSELQRLPSYIDHLSNAFRLNCHNENAEGFTPPDQILSISKKVPIYILWKQLRLSDGEEIPLLSIV